MKKIIKDLIIARWLYSIGEDTMSDIEYNKLLQDPSVVGDVDFQPYLRRTWSEDPCPVDLLKEFNLEQYIRDDIIYIPGTESLTPVNDSKELHRIFKGDKVVISAKVDGWNIRHRFVEGKYISSHTRGRKGNSNTVDLSHLMPDKISNFTGTLISEVFITDKDFNELRKVRDAKSQRNSVSTLLANKELADKYLSMVVFEIAGYSGTYLDELRQLTDWGFQVPVYYYTKLGNLEEISNSIDTRCHELGVPTDGMVVSNTRANGEYTNRVATRIHAYSEDSYIVVVRGLENTRGPRKININCVINKVNIDGRDIERVTLTNLSKAKALDLKPDKLICIQMRAGIIPVVAEGITLKLKQNKAVAEYIKTQGTAVRYERGKYE